MRKIRHGAILPLLLAFSYSARYGNNETDCCPTRMGKEKQRPLPKSELAGLQTEALFEYHAGKTGVNVYPGKPITCDHPVGSGRSKKQYTLPDFFLVDPIRQRGIHVEVTAGNAPKRADKRMQRKVAEAAHVTNYVQVSGDDVLALAEAPPKKKRSILFHILGW